MNKTRLDEAVRRVVANDNCTGCGGCSLISSRIDMRLDSSGFSRPNVAPLLDKSSDRTEAHAFSRICPGVRLSAPRAETATEHPTFGRYVSAWRAYALDPEIRRLGSSGGVLTALSSWLVESGRTNSVVGSRAGRDEPNRTVPVRIMSRAEALESAGSRYGPVSNLTEYSPDASVNALIGKPCEVSAAAQYHDHLNTPPADRPLTLAFFCAGTPSQAATDKLVTDMGVDPDDVVDLRYRGDGWPGEFKVTLRDGTSRAMSYEDSWGKHLGRDLQWRCKLCPDGTGAHADVAVGDFWDADDKGFPMFEEQEGISVAIARNRRGHEVLLEAARAGVVVLEELDLDAVAAVQPLQVKRRRLLLGRLVGRLAAGKRIPSYRGYRLVANAARDWKATYREARGTRHRTMNDVNPRSPR